MLSGVRISTANARYPALAALPSVVHASRPSSRHAAEAAGPKSRQALLALPSPEVASKPMGYKILGFAVWQGTKWYLRQRTGGVKTKLAIVGVGALVAVGVAAAGRQAASHQ